MKRSQLCLALGLLVASASAFAADSWSLNAFKPHVLPVLVHVDARGKVTEVSSSTRLSPAFDRLLRSSLDDMIKKPAMDHDRPVASQFVINLALNVTPRDSGDYEASFAYVSAKPVPSGSWYWSHEDGYRLALINRDGLDRWHPRADHRLPRDAFPSPMPRDMDAPNAILQSASRPPNAPGSRK